MLHERSKGMIPIVVSMDKCWRSPEICLAEPETPHGLEDVVPIETRDFYLSNIHRCVRTV